ncbi:hypothetical protein WCQ02_36005 [Paraburkholderia tropica]|uniref:Uncharacterized protein n=1 Tax=Paraburkholderia tropica TaxID=92647 RepID=A0ABX5MDR3_9BURK|nr:hypothetical protein [Paraburkholderia tropica]PXX07049.1 hypothetical protein C7400_13228 [Paraburkholderia tropica]PZW72486.1 hypothetical protein C7399_13228 [Paraburkholderia tropica]
MKAAGTSIWVGLLAAPVVVLGAQSLNYALVQVACATGGPGALSAVSAVGFVFSVFAAWLGYRRWRGSVTGFHARASYAPRAARTSFLALMAMLVAALCAVIQLTMWFPQWLLSPCR